MESATLNQSAGNGTQHRQIDFVANNTNNITKASKVDSASQTSATSLIPAAEASATKAEPPVPVTSAKAAINAMYASRAPKTESILAPSAREAVNAAAGQGAGRNAKSAANLHHGSIQKNIDTSRTSAAALLTRAKSPKPSSEETSAANSYDPLASRLSSVKPSKDTGEQEIPVIRTSLKLGSSAKPKPTPVILPPHARMARSARPVESRRPKPGIIQRRSNDVQIIQPNSINPSSAKRVSSGAKQLASGHADSNSLEVQILPSSKNLPAKAPAKLVKSVPSVPVSARVPRPAGPLRDPQMVGGGGMAARRTAKPSAAPLWPAVAASALSPKPKFRSAPKGYASATPTGVPTDNSYVMATPPKLNLSRHHTPEADFGVVEDYHAAPMSELSNSQAPVNQFNMPSTASGQSATKEAPAIKADNTSSYSFSLKKKPADNNRYALGGQSPFLKSVSVEKRPLSDNSAPGYTKIERPVVEEKPTKASRKNVYAKKKAKSEIRQELPQRPTVIVPASRRSKVPLFFLILFTIILGAVVGAAAYLCFFQ